MSLVASSSSVKKESYPLLRDAYAIIDGIPESQFNLDHWRKKGRSPRECGTIACAAGWLAMNPEMRKKGLLNGEGGKPVFVDDLAIKRTEYHALAKFFCMNLEQAIGLFCSRYVGSPYDPDPYEAYNYSDKEFWKYRVRKFLEETPV
jgi:hypothetical protein